MVHIYNGILLGHKKSPNLTTCNSIDRLREYYAKKIIQSKKENSIWFHLFVKYKEENKWANKMEAES